MRKAIVGRPERPANPLLNGQNAVAFTGVNGVPLGGIGAGCVELLPDGRLANFCTTNNYHRNQRIESMPGTFFAFAAAGQLRLLQSASTLPLGETGRMLLLDPEDLDYDGLYPRATINYRRGLFPIDITLEASGPVVPEDMLLASLPAALFTFTLKNTSDTPAWGSLLFSWENIAGCMHGVFPAGRRMRMVMENERLRGLEFSAPEQCAANQQGAHVLYIAAPDGAEVTAARYNTWDVGPILAQIEDTGSFGDGAWERVFYADSEYTGGLACKLTLAPGETATVTFALAWHYPSFRIEHSEMAASESGVDDIGHMYANHFSDAQAVAQTALARREDIIARVAAWQQAVLQSSLPDWLGRMLINSLYVLSPGTLWAQDGRFSLMETPYGPMMGTLDQRFYASIGTALFFPELERTELSLFAETKHPADRGRVFHDLGNLRFNDPKTGTTAKKWTDLNPKFVLMALRNYQWTNDRAEIERLWPAITEMMAYSRSQDTDGDGLPNNDDRSTTYDDWAFFGANSYSASLWLGALHAFRKLASLLNREEDWLPYIPVLELATGEFEARLWNESLGYYRLYNDDRNAVFTAEALPDAGGNLTQADAAVNQGAVPLTAQRDHPEVNDDCHDGQLAGQWYADLLGLGSLVNPVRIRSAVQQIYRRNATAHGVRKGVNPHGGEAVNPPSSCWWSEAGHCWPGYEVGHYAALAIYHGEVVDALTTVERLYRDIHEERGLAWNQPLRWNVESGYTYGWGCDRYMNSPAAWFVYLALAGLVLNRPEQEIGLRPRLLPGHTQLDLPLFTPGNWGRLQVTATPVQRTIILRFDHPEPVRTLWLEANDTHTITLPQHTGSYTSARIEDALGARWQLTFTVGTAIGVEGLVIEMTD